MTDFSREQEESIQRKIELYSPLLEKNISNEECMRRIQKIENELTRRRLKWYEDHKHELGYLNIPDVDADVLQKAFVMIILHQMEICPADVKVLPFYDEDQGLYTFYIESRNFCPYLEAFKRMSISPEDSVRLCELTLEKPCQALAEKVNPRIRFFRNYSCIRPAADYCDERLLIGQYFLPEGNRT